MTFAELPNHPLLLTMEKQTLWVAALIVDHQVSGVNCGVWKYISEVSLSLSLISGRLKDDVTINIVACFSEQMHEGTAIVHHFTTPHDVRLLLGYAGNKTINTIPLIIKNKNKS